MGTVASNHITNESISKNYISWFEIPAINIQQAVFFYNQIFGIDMVISDNNEFTMAFFPTDTGVGGAVVSGPGCIPSDNGPLLYLNGGNDLNDILNKIPEAGGRIVMHKTLISDEAGYFAIFIDTEGNKLALHSQN